MAGKWTREAIARFIEGKSLSRQEAQRVMSEILAGDASEAQISAFLVAMQMKGSTVDEIAGSVDAYRERITPLSIADPNAIDISGTGGDNLGTFNISTATAFVAAAAGARIIKHGYHSVSSQCGSADVLKELGIETQLFPDQIYKIYEQLGLAFVFAPRFKPIPRNLAGIRQNIGARTLINILDPITKPALTMRQLIGVYDVALARIVADVLAEIGVTAAMVVCGENGLDELNISGKTFVVELEDGVIREYELHPSDVGMECYPVESLQGGTAELNCRILENILEGVPGAPLEVTVFNAAAALKVAGVTSNLAEGLEKARAAIDDRSARNLLTKMIELSNEI